MVPKSILILVPHDRDRNELLKSTETLRSFRVDFEVRYVSPELAPELLEQILATLSQCSVVLCWSQEESFLFRYVNARTDRPVLSLGIAGENVALMQAMRVIANENLELREELRRERLSQSSRIASLDKAKSEIFVST